MALGRLRNYRLHRVASGKGKAKHGCRNDLSEQLVTKKKAGKRKLEIQAPEML